jgi:hypothetical protein
MKGPAMVRVLARFVFRLAMLRRGLRAFQALKPRRGLLLFLNIKTLP